MRYGLVLCLCIGCGGRLSSDAEAELAYIGLNGAVERAMRLGLRGFSEASSAHIDPQEDEGDVSGTMVVTGKADQGVSANKGLRLHVALEDYADLVDVDEDDRRDVEIVYETDAPANLDLQLKDIPTGDLSGTFKGTFFMIGDLEGEVTLDLSLDGRLEPDSSVPEGVRRKDGSTKVIGTATHARGGTYHVDLEI